jgi:hypothetical protein
VRGSCVRVSKVVPNLCEVINGANGENDGKITGSSCQIETQFMRTIELLISIIVVFSELSVSQTSPMPLGNSAGAVFCGKTS